MTKKASILFIFLLIFQTISSSLVLPTQANAEGKDNGIFMNVSVKNEAGKDVTLDELQEAKGESAVEVHVDWSISDVDVKAGSTEKRTLDSILHIAEYQEGILTTDETEVGMFGAETDGTISITFDEAMEGHEDASGTFTVEASVEGEDVLEDEVEKVNGYNAESENNEEEVTEEDMGASDKEKDEESAREVEEEDDVETLGEVDEEDTETPDPEKADEVVENENAVDKSDADAANEKATLPREEEKHGFNLELGEITKPNGDPFPEGSHLNPKNQFQLKLNWDLDDDHNYKDGDTKVFDLPKGIVINDDFDAELRDDFGQLVATYKVTKDNKIELTFTDFVENHSNVKGWLGIISKLDKENVEVEDGNAILDPIGEEGALKIPIDRGEIKKTIEKSGTPNKGYNADEIKWEVIINKDKMDLKDAKIADELPDGTEYKEGTLKVTKLKVSLDGTILGDEEIVDVTGEIVDENGNLNIPLGDIKDAYRVEYVTTVTDEDKKEFVNNATLSDDDLEDASTNATATIKRGEAIKKKAAKAYNPKTGIIEWEIEFNYNLKELNDETLKDAWQPAGKLDLVDGSLKFTEMTIDEDGNAHETETVGLPDGATLVPGTDQFEITGISTDRAYKVTYQTKVKDRVFDPIDVTNTAGFGTDHKADSGTEVGTYYGSKSAGKVDYKNKTIDWKIEINHDEFPMEKISVKDTLGEGLTLDKDSLKVTVDGKAYTDFTLVEGNPFEVQFPESYVTDKKIEISYQTGFDADKVPDHKPTNKAAITWTPEGSSDSITKEVEDGTELNDDTKNNDWKSGSYDPATKEITWTIYTNYRENDIDNLIVKDAPQGNQKIVADSVVVTELAVDADGNMTEGKTLNKGVASIDKEANTMEVNIRKTSIAHKIEYRTSVAGLNNIQLEYFNKAEVLDDSEKLSDLDASVGIANAETYGDKSGTQDGKQIHWSIDVNLGQQKVKDLKLVDTITENQDYLADTIKVYEVKYEDGKAVKGNPVSSNDYTLTHTKGEQTFTVVWNKTVERAFIVEYSTLFFAGHDEEVTNGYKIAGDNISDDNESTDSGASVSIKQFGTGGGSGEAGYLVIDKIDTTDGRPEGKLAGVKFDLIDADTGNLLKTEETDEEGQIDFGRLLFGDYELVEHVPEGYVSVKEKQTITIDKQYDPDADKAVYTTTVDNYEPVFAVELTKTDDVDGSVLLEGVEFQLLDSEDEVVGTGTTNSEGKVLFENLGKAGTYYAQETSTLDNYVPSDKKFPVRVGSKERVPVEMTVENTLYPGKGTLTKVDTENTGGLKGAVFEVFDKDGTKVDTFTTGENGVGTTKELRPGKYTVKELTPPKGFEKSDTEHELVIPIATEIEEYAIGTDNGTIKNDVKTTSIELTKSDSINGNQLLDGAEFELSYKSGDYSLAGSPVSGTTADFGKVTFDNLKPGKYEITETNAPDGYIKAKDPIEVEVTLDNVHEGTIVTEDIENEPLANVIVQKEDSETDFALKGAEFKVTNEADDVRTGLITDGKGQISITGLPAGTYNLVETKAPTGYEKDETSQSFEVKDGVETTVIIKKTFKNEIIKGSVELEKVDGDNNNTALEGVEFTLEATSPVNDGTYEATKHTTDSDGKISVNDLRPGKYKIIETGTLEGYQSHWKDITFEIKLQNDVQKIEFTGDKAIVNYKLVDIAVEKKWEDLWTENANAERPEEIKVDILQNDKVIDSYEMKATEDWKHKFEKQEAVDSSGNKYTYTVKEQPVKGYKSAVTEDVTDSFIVTNTAKTTSLELTKQDSINGNKLKDAEFALTYPDGTTTKKATTDENGKLTFTDLQPGKYSVKETKAPTGYIADSTPLEVEVTLDNVEKGTLLSKTIKNDPFANVQFQKVDAETDVALTGAKFKVVDTDDKEVEGYTDLSVENDGTLSITGLPVGDYKLVETEAPVGYELNEDGVDFKVAAGESTDVQKLVNYDNEITRGSVTFIKKDSEGNTLKDVAFTLESISLVNDADSAYKETHKTDSNGKMLVENLRPGKYKFTEIFPDGYQDYNGADLTFTIDPVDGETNIDLKEVINHKLIDVKVTKEWKDDNNATENRPDEITVELFRNDNLETPYRTKDITGDGGVWDYTFKDLDAVDSAGKDYTYTINEQEVDGYTSSEPEATDDGYKISNLRTGTIDVAGEKTWMEAENGEQYRPNSITVNLLSGDEIVKTIEKVTADDGWKYAFEGLDEFDSEGKKISYTIEEESLTGYKSQVKDYNITNTQETIYISGTKTWKDNGEDRPDSPITVQVMNGTEVVQQQEITTEEDSDFTFKDLAKYDKEGKEIKYTLNELPVLGYKTDIDGFDITNTRSDKVDVEGTKTWKDDESAERPTEITIQLKVNGEEVDTVNATKETDWKYAFRDLDAYDENGIAIEYTVAEDIEGYKAVFNGYDITNVRTGKTEVNGEKKWVEVDEQYRPDSITVNLLANDERVADTKASDKTEWKYSFTDLAKYDSEGKEITYKIKEVKVPGYESEVKNYNITNTQESTEVTGEKTWVEVDKRYRPDTVTIQLFANSEEETTVEVSSEADWTYEFTDLAKYDKDGEEIDYTVKELDVPAGYNSEVDGFEIINTQKTTEVSGTKTWLDDNSGERPNAITVQVKNGDEVIDEKEVTSDDEWMYTFTNLAKYDKEGSEIEYTIDEVEIDGYEKELEDNDRDITNIRTGTTDVDITKSWVDENNTDRPDTIKVNLLQNGNPYGDPYEMTAENDWKLTISDLPKYDNQGFAYEYSVTEHDVPGYASKVDGFDITNTRADTKDINITKTWLDTEESAKRPDEIKVELFRSIEDGDKESVGTYEMTGAEYEKNWSLTIEEPPAFDKDGKAYTYEIEEEAVDGYETTINGFDITNLRVGDPGISGEKTWLDGESEKRPERITVILYQNGVEIDRTVTTAEDNWEYSFTKLPSFDEKGAYYEYEVKEKPTPGYEALVDGYDIRNLRVGTTSVEGEKIWKDDQKSNRPDSITVELLANGEKISSMEVTVEMDWTYTFADLPQYDGNGVEYEYTVSEQPVEDYESTVNGYDITNTFISKEAANPDQEKDSDTPKNNDDKDTPDTSKDSSSDGDTLPETATDIYNYLLAGFMLMAIGFGLFILSRRRRYM